MGMAEIIAIISLVVTSLAIPALLAIHKTRTQSVIQEEKPGIIDAAHKAMVAHVKQELEEERSRAKELFAAKHEMSEMRGLVNQLVQNTSKLDEKLDRMHELLLQLAKTR